MRETLNNEFHLDYFTAYHKQDMIGAPSLTYIPRQLDLPLEYLRTVNTPDSFLGHVIEYRVSDLYQPMSESLASIVRLINHQLWDDLVIPSLSDHEL